MIMKWLTPLLALIAFIAIGCNHEGPINVAGYDDNSTIQWRVDKAKNPDELLYTIYLPASWCPNPPQDSISPWIMTFIKGSVSVRRIYNFEIQAAEPGKENYYKHTFVVPRDGALRVMLDYGNHRNGNDPDNASRALLKGRDNPFVLLYQPTTDRADDLGIIGLTMVDSWVGPVDNNILLPLEAKIGVDLPARAARDVRFTVADLSYTEDIGIKDYVWEFADGYVRKGKEVFKRFDKAGKQTVQLTITDNLGTKLVIARSIDVTN